jgi:hypothetical protein
MFHHDCPLVVKPASMPQCLRHKKNLRDSLPIDMLPFSVTIPATVLQRSEIPDGLMNYAVLTIRYFPVYRHCCMAYNGIFDQKEQVFRKMEISEEFILLPYNKQQRNGNLTQQVVKNMVHIRFDGAEHFL